MEVGSIPALVLIRTSKENFGQETISKVLLKNYFYKNKEPEDEVKIS